MKKPTGVAGPLRFHSDVTGTSHIGFEQVVFPRTKAAVEKAVAERFVVAANRRFDPTGQRRAFFDLRQNEEDGFDFRVSTPVGLADLELMEIAPLTGPYSQAPAVHNSFDFAKTILAGILDKSHRYAAQGQLFLLLYSTHWAFTLTPPALACLRFWCGKDPHVFRGILFFKPVDNDDGILEILFPFPREHFRPDFDPEEFRQHESIILDPTKWVAEGDNGA